MFNYTSILNLFVREKTEIESTPVKWDYDYPQGSDGIETEAIIGWKETLKERKKEKKSLTIDFVRVIKHIKFCARTIDDYLKKYGRMRAQEKKDKEDQAEKVIRSIFSRSVVEYQEEKINFIFDNGGQKMIQFIQLELKEVLGIDLISCNYSINWLEDIINSKREICCDIQADVSRVLWKGRMCSLEKDNKSNPKLKPCDSEQKSEDSIIQCRSRVALEWKKEEEKIEIVAKVIQFRIESYTNDLAKPNILQAFKHAEAVSKEEEEVLYNATQSAVVEFKN